MRMIWGAEGKNEMQLATERYTHPEHWSCEYRLENNGFESAGVGVAAPIVLCFENHNLKSKAPHYQIKLLYSVGRYVKCLIGMFEPLSFNSPLIA